MSDDKSYRIYRRTDGRCHLCGKKLAFTNYGVLGARGAWEIEHSGARANGGTDHGNNLYAACIGCNRAKGSLTSRTARAWNGRTRAPLSTDRKRQVRRKNTILGGGIGALIGGAMFGPAGALLIGGAGAIVGNELDPD